MLNSSVIVPELIGKSFFEISNYFGSDKTTYHEYHKIYPTFIERFRDDQFSLLEIGIDRGKSYRLWEHYFPKANIFGMDINSEFRGERGQVFMADQSRLEDLMAVSSYINSCKLIIDDGSHHPEHQLKSFYYLFENLLEFGGIYIIEDIECSYWKPDAAVYGYPTGYLNIIDYFTKLNHLVNARYNLQKNPLHIETITYGPNCIIIKKLDHPREEGEIPRFIGMIK